MAGVLLGASFPAAAARLDSRLCGRRSRSRYLVDRLCRGRASGRRGSSASLRGEAGLAGSAARPRGIGLLARVDRHAAAGFAQPRQFGLGDLVRRIELQRLVISLTGQAGIDVPEILARQGIARVGSDGHFERRPRLFVLFLLGVNDRKIVVGLGQFGIIFAQCAEHRHRLGRLAHLDQDQAFEKSATGFFRPAGNVAVDFFKCLRRLPLFEQALRVRKLVCSGKGDHAVQSQADEQGGQGGRQRFLRVCAHRYRVVGLAAVECR
jgi:hypothetical protein